MKAGLGRTSLTLVPLALLARGAGFFVSIAIAGWFGVSAATDAWYWALAVPTLAVVLASSAVSTALTPHIARLLEAPDGGDEGELVGSAATWIALSTLLLCLPVCLFGPQIVGLVTRFGPDASQLAALFLWEALPIVVMTAMNAVFRAACEVHGRFRAVSLLPIARAAVDIAFIAAFRDLLGPHCLPWGLAAGELALMFGYLWVLRGTGTRIRPSLRLSEPLKQVGRDFSLIFGGEVLVALNIVVDKACAAFLPEGAVATLEFASRARVVPQSLLESTLVMVAFATWSRLYAAGNHEEANRQLNQSLQWTAVIAAPVLAGMLIGREVLIGVMFERGAFVAADTARTASVLGWYVPGLLPNLLGILAVKAHIVAGNLRLVLVLGLASLVLNLAFNLLLMGPMGIDGLALSTTLSVTLVAGLYIVALAPRLQGSGWLPAGLIVLGSAVVAMFVEASFGAPQSLLSPVLWGASVPCFVLLGLGLWVGGRAPKG